MFVTYFRTFKYRDRRQKKYYRAVVNVDGIRAPRVLKRHFRTSTGAFLYSKDFIERYQKLLSAAKEAA